MQGISKVRKSCSLRSGGSEGETRSRGVVVKCIVGNHKDLSLQCQLMQGAQFEGKEGIPQAVTAALSLTAVSGENPMSGYLRTSKLDQINLIKRCVQ